MRGFPMPILITYTLIVQLIDEVFKQAVSPARFS